MQLVRKFTDLESLSGTTSLWLTEVPIPRACNEEAYWTSWVPTVPWDSEAPTFVKGDSSFQAELDLLESGKLSQAPSLLPCENIACFSFNEKPEQECMRAQPSESDACVLFMTMLFNRSVDKSYLTSINLFISMLGKLYSDFLMIKCNNSWCILTSNEWMLLFTRQFYKIRHQTQELSLGILTIYWAPSWSQRA